MKNKFLSILLSFVVAFGLWLYVINVVSPGSKETFYNIEVVLEGISALNSRGLMITDTSDTTVDMELSGNRSDLIKLNSSNITLKADLSKIYDEGTITVYYTTNYPGDVANNAVTVESQYPKYITLTVEKKDTDEIPVKIVTTGSVGEGYMVDKENAVLDYSSITVTGPRSVVEQIAEARIEVDLTDRTESISESYRFTLCDAEGEPVDAKLITVSVEEVRLDMVIQRYKEVPVTYTLVEGGGATADTAQITLSQETISVAGNEAMLEEINEIALGTINLGEIPEDTTMTFAVNLPEGVTNLSEVTEVTVDVAFPDLETKEFTVETIETINVPEGLEAQVIATKLNVSIRGPKALIAKLSAGDIKLVIDFANAELGTATYKAAVVLSEKYAEAGAVGAYTVSATVQETPADETTEEG